MVRTAGSTLSWLTVAGLGAMAVGLKVGCAPIPQEDEAKQGESAYEDEEVVIAVSNVLADVGPQVIIPSLEAFSSALGGLDDAIDSWEAAHSAGQDTSTARSDAQLAWADAMMAWQENEVLQIGPAGSSLSAIAGSDLRDEVYSWPTINTCRVDQEVVAAVWDTDGWFEDNLVNSYGLDALEHVLYGGDANDCPSQVEINSEGSWDALGPAGVETNRIAFARALTDHAGSVVDDLIAQWSPTGGNFSGQLDMTAGNSPYFNDQEALNAVFDGLFYLETVTKDRKIAQPLGMVECSLETCPDDSEHLESGVSTMAIAANLRGFRRLFSGGDGAGFDDLLVQLGHADLAEDILTKTDAAIDVAENTDVPVHTGVVSDTATVEALHTAVKAVTDLLKNDLVTVLSLEVPAEAAGDND